MQDVREFDAKMRVASELQSINKHSDAIDMSSRKSVDRLLAEQQVIDIVDTSRSNDFEYMRA